MTGQVRIDRIYAFLVVDADGTEAICGVVGAEGFAYVESVQLVAAEIAAALRRPITVRAFADPHDLGTIAPAAAVRVDRGESS